MEGYNPSSTRMNLRIQRIKFNTHNVFQKLFLHFYHFIQSWSDESYKNLTAIFIRVDSDTLNVSRQFLMYNSTQMCARFSESILQTTNNHPFYTYKFLRYFALGFKSILLSCSLLTLTACSSGVCSHVSWNCRCRNMVTWVMRTKKLFLP